MTPACRPCLPPLPKGVEADRLGLANWLVDPAQPAHGARGGQPLLADALRHRARQDAARTSARRASGRATRSCSTGSRCEFVDSGWDVKAMQRLIVTSATYRQSSQVTPELLEQRSRRTACSPAGPRFRLPAEMIRDQALAVSGLLVEKLGGPSRQAVPAAAALGGADRRHRRPRRPDLRAGPRRGALPPQPVHVLEAHGAAAGADGVRRAEPRDLHRPPVAHQHAAAGAGAAERPDLRRGRAQLAERR